METRGPGGDDQAMSFLPLSSPRIRKASEAAAQVSRPRHAEDKPAPREERRVEARRPKPVRRHPILKPLRFEPARFARAQFRSDSTVAH